ncbi:hypothetical protein [uncultured Phascolarctobacterium sp.]|jgi:hypothetical protein|uniref:hypothetical protein n=1 Tax=uncultured Phascolarctobacterium sp. TaxID=512296 RepID=UPI0025E4A5EA|nr:hypothetical protein [uncultured Phascolarctobacterium sp.]
MSTELVLEVCLAVRRDELQAARDGFTKILESAAKQSLFKAIGDCLLAAVRRQQRQLFDEWLEQAREALLSLAAEPERSAEAAEFLTRLSFVVCDRRLAEAQPALAQLVRRFANAAAVDIAAKLWAELLSLAARMARRGWSEETAFLLRLYLRELLKRDDSAVWQQRLLALQLHFVAYARWDGFTKACAAYQELLLLFLLLVRRAGKKIYTKEQQEQYLLLSLRTLRGIISNAARSSMKDDMEIFRELYQYLWQLAGDNKRLRQQLQLLLQLAISYWQSSLPKTSRKQARFLEDLLQPSLIDKLYEDLLNRI